MVEDESRREVLVPQAAVDRRPARSPGTALERLFQEYRRDVYRIAYRITGNASDAEDVLQTVFMRLLQLQQEGRIVLSDQPAGYLHRAAVNAALDVLRSRRSQAAAPLEEVAPHLAADPGDGPEQRHRDRELEQRVRRALAELSPRAAEAFVLRYFEGYRNKDIARLLRTSRVTIGVLLHRTRQRLREEIRAALEERHEA